VSRKPLKIVVLGIMSRMPFGGLVWGTMQYLVGFDRLGHEVYYVEAHGSTPRTFIEKTGDDPWARGAEYVNGVMQRLNLAHRWAFHAVHDGRHFGMTESQLKELYASADLIINLHGATRPLAEHFATGRLLFLDTDPGETQIEANRHNPPMLEALGRHRAFFTWALNYGRPDCELPVTAPFDFRPTPPPIVPDFWESSSGNGGGPTMTTVGNWRQDGCDVAYRGDVYRWSKHHEFVKFIDLPERTTQPFELALSSCTEADCSLLEQHGWRVRDAIFSRDLDAYRSYIVGSRAEFTVAKDLNVRLRSGWFSERSASYLAAGRPVITQDTGFGNILPTGEGLFAFSTTEEAVDAVERIRLDYGRHSRAARQISREFFSYDVVLPKLLERAA
jgi:hypothetical protein